MKTLIKFKGDMFGKEFEASSENVLTDLYNLIVSGAPHIT
jgi:hypothetical protein